jgi:hypothetical protein
MNENRHLTVELILILGSIAGAGIYLFHEGSNLIMLKKPFTTLCCWSNILLITSGIRYIIKEIKRKYNY